MSLDSPITSFPTISEYLAEFESVARSQGFTISSFGQSGGYQLLAACRAAQGNASRCIYLSSGIHGDEPAGPLAILEAMKRGCFSAQAEWWLCPLLNPIGVAAGTREGERGIDLNRDYPAGKTSAIRRHMKWLQRCRRCFDVSIHLHEDWEASGFYLYEVDIQQTARLAGKLLEAASKIGPIDTHSEIDGREAAGGRILLPECLQDLPDGSEAVYMVKRMSYSSYTLETPSSYELNNRIQTHLSCLNTISEHEPGSAVFGK